VQPVVVGAEQAVERVSVAGAGRGDEVGVVRGGAVDGPERTGLVKR
jgi:hypothetical protein